MALSTATGMSQAAPEKVGPPVEPGWILAKLQRPLPASTPFLELRGSRLLKAPLRISGRYLRPDADTLVRDVTSPYLETTTLSGGVARVARTGQKTRTFKLARAPELAALLSSFGALLSGDRGSLERHYILAATGTTGHWQLLLTPRDKAMATKTRGIVLHGRGSELRCIETRTPAGEPQRTLLAGAARVGALIPDAQALAALCHGNGHGHGHGKG
ncbi:MAG: fatty acyl CoA synthetase [Pseudomonadota bacterium]|nr:fatty acyl CoA synthetase [Pseudomonadota bacterium]